MQLTKFMSLKIILIVWFFALSVFTKKIVLNKIIKK